MKAGLSSSGAPAEIGALDGKMRLDRLIVQ
jgi:hypothetical protein